MRNWAALCCEVELPIRSQDDCEQGRKKMEYFAGIDVSLRSCALCIVDGKGTVLLERELPCEVCEIAECLGAFPHPIERIGFEAGTVSQHLFFGLKAAGFDVVCMEARQVNAALSAMRNKTDKNAARGIAQVLRTGWFSPVHVKSREAHGVRALLSTRKALLKKTMDLANEVRGLLKIFGIRGWAKSELKAKKDHS